jgi:hypothetical protein
MSVLLDFIILACLLIPSCLHFSLKDSRKECAFYLVSLSVSLTVIVFICLIFGLKFNIFHEVFSELVQGGHGYLVMMKKKVVFPCLTHY